MCFGHACGVHWIDLEDQRRAGGMLLGCLCVLGVPWRSLGVLWVSLGRSLGVLVASGNVLGSSCGALGVILEVWSHPWSSPGRAECCYFVGFR